MPSLLELMQSISETKKRINKLSVILYIVDLYLEFEEYKIKYGEYWLDVFLNDPTYDYLLETIKVHP